ncbi:MAG: sodium:solute symporter [Pseudomonadota bacterium]
MTTLDWAIVGAYLAGLLAVGALIGRGQTSRKDYFLGGQRMPAAALATSTIATQCSTNSLLGAPAFVGFVAGGGMVWLQYELAVPLAMLALMFLFRPIRAGNHISIYAFLEERLGGGARLIASGSFQLFRGVATGVTVYGVALVVTLLVDVSFTQAVLILMGATIAYDVLGGMRAVVISDVVQIVLIVLAVTVSLAFLLIEIGGPTALLTERTRAIDPSWGFADASNYGFWPMLIGGFFLYTAYYGCDQSQAQRVLAAKSPVATERVLLLNGLLRFPLVLLYCLLGLALAAYATQSDLLQRLPLSSNGAPNVNLVFPVYVLEAFPAGLVGLVMVGLFAAAMSSIDSALNSLSAATLEDFVNPRRDWSERRLFLLSKLITLGWGLFAVVFSFQVERIAPTVLEAINKIGSMANGPLLALFVIALLAPGVGQGRAILAFFSGLLANAAVWAFAPGVSWLWWNVSGFLVSVTLALLLARVPLRFGELESPSRLNVVLLTGMAVLVLLVCLAFSAFAR